MSGRKTVVTKGVGQDRVNYRTIGREEKKHVCRNDFNETREKD